MKKYIYYLMAFAALAVVSCQPEKKQAEEEEIEGSVEFSVNPTCVVPAEGAEAVELSVISNVPFEPIIEEGADWLRLVEDGKAETAASSFTIAVDPQPDADSPSRSAVITFKNTESLEVISTKMSVLTVIQKDAKGLAISITQPGVVDFQGAYLDDENPKLDDDLQVKFKSNIPLAPYIPELKEGATAKEQEEYEEAYGWIHIVEAKCSYDAAKGEGVFSFEVYENLGAKARSAEIGIIRLDKEFDKVEDAIVEGKTIKISQEGRISQMLFVVDGEAADSVGEIIPEVGGNASFIFAASCPIEPYFAEGGELEYTITPGEMFSTISFKVPANAAEEAAHYTIYFKDVTEPEKEEAEAKSLRATKEISLLRNIYTGELISVNFLVLAELKGFALEETDPFELEYGKSVALTPVFTPAGAEEGREIEWASSDGDILSVEDGLVTAVGVGDATITATVEGFAPSVDITVPWAISFAEEEIEIEFADPVTLTPIFLPAEAGEGVTLEWSSSDEDVATVANGVVTPVNTGVTTITVTVGEKSASIDVYVVPQILYGEDFENFTGEGWNMLDGDKDGNNWKLFDARQLTGIPAYSGNYALISFSWNGVAFEPDNYIWTPKIQLKDTDNYLDFQVGTNPSYPDYYAAYIMDDEGMVPVSYGWVSPATNENYVHVTVPIPGQFAGKAVSVVFRHFNCSDMNYLAVDDVFVTYGDPSGFDLEVPSDGAEGAPMVSTKLAGKNVPLSTIKKAAATTCRK